MYSSDQVVVNVVTQGFSFNVIFQKVEVKLEVLLLSFLYRLIFVHRFHLLFAGNYTDML